jgi:hypothetical protein
MHLGLAESANIICSDLGGAAHFRVLGNLIVFRVATLH